MYIYVTQGTQQDGRTFWKLVSDLDSFCSYELDALLSGDAKLYEIEKQVIPTTRIEWRHEIEPFPREGV